MQAAERDGFTLIEMVIVLAIISGLLVLAYASFAPLYARVRVAYERDDLERQLTELPQRVRLSGHGGVLTARSGEDLPASGTVQVEGAPAWGAALENWQVLRLALPSGWSLRIDKPIFYHFNGSCEGGEVVFVLAPTAVRYVLAPPLCRPPSPESGDAS